MSIVFIISAPSGSGKSTLVQRHGELIKIKDAVIFSNYLSLKGYVLKLDKKTKKNITIDFSEVNLVDHSVMAALKNLRSLLVERGQTLTLENMDHMTPVSEHPLAARIGI